MATQRDIPLIISNEDTGDSEVMLTTYTGATTQPNYESIKEDEVKILGPGDQLMTRQEVPLYPIYIYVLYYFFLLGFPFLLVYLSYEFAQDVVVEEYVSGMIFIFPFIGFTGWFIGAVFYNCCGMPSNYTRKIGHLFFFFFPVLAAGGIAGFVDADGDMFGGFDTSAAFGNIVLDVLWAAWSSQAMIFLMSRPTRMLANYICGNTRSKRITRWCNCCENTMDAFERPEDRPNHLLWLNTQSVLFYFFLFALSFWWEELDSGVAVLIPTFIGGLGDGLAEPVGVKWGKNCCGIDNRYKVHGCCTKHDYTRSIAGSSMVLLSGYIGVGLAYNEYTMWQLIIAMVIVPPLGCIVEAKAPHTLDNPFIAAIVGVVATAILYIPY